MFESFINNFLFTQAMRYAVYKQFPEQAWNERKAYYDLSCYLLDNHLSPILHEHALQGGAGFGVNFHVTLAPFGIAANKRGDAENKKVKIEMKGTLDFPDVSASQKKAMDLLALLAQYNP